MISCGRVERGHNMWYQHIITDWLGAVVIVSARHRPGLSSGLRAHLEAKMAMALELSGNGLGGFGVQAFIKGFVAGLVTHDVLAIRLQDRETQRAFGRVVSGIDDQIDEVEAVDGERAFARDLVEIANSLRGGNTGAYDGFEASLREVQTTFTSSPNPSYDEIAFSVPRLYAKAVIERMSRLQRRVVDRAVDDFLGAGRGGDESQPDQAAS